MCILAQAEAAANDALTPLEKLHSLYGAGPSPPQAHYRILDLSGRPIACHLCGRFDRWTVDGDLWPVAICEHAPIVATCQMAIRQVSSMPFWKIGQIEQIGE